jgi:hypothetical protein
MSTQLLIASIIYAYIGFIAGILTNNFAVYLFKRFQIYNLHIQNAIHVFLCAIVLMMFQLRDVKFSEEWQATTPGLFFVFGFFGSQFNLFRNIDQTYAI